VSASLLGKLEGDRSVLQIRYARIPPRRPRKTNRLTAFTLIEPPPANDGPVGRTLLILSCLGLSTTPVTAQQLDAELLEAFSWRALGPAVFSGRIVDLELIPGKPFDVLAASASGGLFRTRNNGTTWECIFEDEALISIGDVAVDPRRPEVLWIGTGEANNQRSSYWGAGVYKSTDGGESWVNVGLADSQHIGRIAVHPGATDTVYVAALGHLYTQSEERGLFKTTDGGETWEKVLHVDERVGVVDVALDPREPETVYAATYERLRRAWHFDGAGPGSAIHRSTDGGATWTRLAGGLPSGEIGRIGLAVFPGDPRIVYATVSNQNPDPDAGAGDPVDLGFRGEFADGGYRVREVTEGSRAEAAGLQPEDLLLELGGVALADPWDLLRAVGQRAEGERVELRVQRGDKDLTFALELEKVARRDREPPTIGGEVYRSDDGGETWTKRNERPVGGSPPYYYGQIRVHPTDADRIWVLGVPLFASVDGGETWQRGNAAGSVHVDHHALVIDPAHPERLLLGNDGGLAISYDSGATWDHYANLPLAQFYAVGVDEQVPYHVYGGTQDNGTWGGPSRSRSGRGITNEEWYRVGGGDGFYVQPDPRDPDTVYGEAQFGALYRLDKRTWESTPIRPTPTDPDGPRDRFNWSSPILVSSHNPEIVYFGGNRLFKSFDRGDSWPVVSPDLTTADEQKIAGNVPHCTITTIAESPLDPSLLLVGTDDGLVQRSRDGGLSWTNVTGRFPGAPAGWWVSRVVLSPHERDVGFVTFTGYREDDFRPFAYMTRDAGESWAPIHDGLPPSPVNVLQQDPRNPRVLWLGNERGVLVSIDQGEHWNALRSGLPAVAVHDLVVHARDRDVVIGTHGRGIYVLEAGPLQELSSEVLAQEVHLFEVEPAYLWRRVDGPGSGSSGDRGFRAPNPSSDCAIWYHLRAEAPEDGLELEVRDAAGNRLRELRASNAPGLHRVDWDLRGSTGEDEGDGDGEGRRRRAGRPRVEPGTYTAVLRLGEDELRADFEVRADPFGRR